MRGGEGGEGREGEFEYLTGALRDCHESISSRVRSMRGQDLGCFQREGARFNRSFFPHMKSLRAFRDERAPFFPFIPPLQ